MHCFSNRCHCRNHRSTSGQAGQETLPEQIPGPGPSPIGSTNPAPPAPPPVHPFRPSSRISANSVPAPHPGLRVCRRAFCRNSVADCCRTGHCPRHCSSQRCPCKDPLAEADAAQLVCKRSIGFCPSHCPSQRCSCRVGASDPQRLRLCRRSDCRSAAANCSSGFCQAHCSCSACGHLAGANLPQLASPGDIPHRRRVCRNPDCWRLVVADCVTGYCQAHCNRTRCSCREVPGVRICRRDGCHASVDVGCRTGFCRTHCFGRACCNHVANPISNRGPGPLQQYLSEMCANLPVDVTCLPDHIRTSFDQ